MVGGCGLSVRAWVWVAMVGWLPLAVAQDVATGSVTGHVMCGDTHKPARFARVMLQGVAGAGHGSDDSRNQNVVSQTDADGNFVAIHLAPGDYYVTAAAPGYISERALLQAAVNAGATPAALLAQIPTVHVDADAASSIVVTMERGATISGRVLWEDGTPAAGTSVSVVSANANNAALPETLQGIPPFGAAQNHVVTDDRGVFRLSGLTSGDYLVVTQIQPPMQNGGVGRMDRFNSAVMIYSPGVFHKAEAKVVSVGSGEERGDLRVVIDLRELRTISGHVSSADPSYSVASGMVSLAASIDTEIRPFTMLLPNGDFTLRYVPPGSYTLKVVGANSQSRAELAQGGQGTHVTFQDGSQAVAVADRDVTDVAMTLTPVQKSP